MPALEQLIFEIITRDHASEGLSKAGQSARKAGADVDGLIHSLEDVGRKAVTARVGLAGNKEALASLNRIDAKLLGLDRRTASPNLKVEGAARALAEISAVSIELDKLGRKKVTPGIVQRSALGAAAGLGNAPALLGAGLLALPAVATLGGATLGAAAGLGGAALAAGGAVAAFGAVALPVLKDAKTATAAVEAAQNQYNATMAVGINKTQAQANLTAANQKALITYNAALAAGKNPAKALIDYHATLAKNQVTYNLAMNQGVFQSKAYATQQKAIAKAYAEMSPQQIALSKQLGNMAQAWQNLKAAQTPVVAGALQPWLKTVTDLAGKIGPVIRDVAPAIGQFGAAFDTVVNSGAFTKFRDFIGYAGSAAVTAAGDLITGLFQGFITLLPQFNPLIAKAIGWVDKLGPAFANWASSQKTADHITAFMDWFNKNGGTVGTLLKNLGSAIGNLAPGFAAGGQLELKVISDFLGWVAKLPKGFAAPVAEVAGAMLVLSKLGVLSVGIKLIGAAAGWIKSLISGTTVDIGAAGMQTAGDTMITAAGLMQKAADTMAGGAVAGGGGGAAAGAAGGAGATLGLFSKGAIAAGGAAIAAGLMLKVRQDVKAGWRAVAGDIPKALQGSTGFLVLSAQGWANAITGHFKPQIMHFWNWVGHSTASTFDTVRHTVAEGWSLVASDTGRLLGGWAHNVAHWFDTARGTVTGIWSSAWSTLERATSTGVNAVARWFKGLPGKITGAFYGVGADMWGIGKRLLNDFLTGLQTVAKTVEGWLGGFAHGVVGIFKKIWGWFSPSRVMYQGGKSLMTGLAAGIKDHAHQAVTAAAGAAHSVSGGVQRWAGLVAKALAMEGLSPNLLGNVLFQMQTESGGNQAAINLTDINAQMGDPSRGLMQVIGSTFAAFHWPGTSWDIYDPLANIAAALNYAKHDYGPTLMNPEGGGIGSGHGYALGTASAAPGWAWVGERGPEMVRFRGGEQVAPAIAGRGGGSGDVHVHLHNDGVIGSQAELDNWVHHTFDRLAMQGKLSWALRQSPSAA